MQIVVVVDRPNIRSGCECVCAVSVCYARTLYNKFKEHVLLGVKLT